MCEAVVEEGEEQGLKQLCLACFRIYRDYKSLFSASIYRRLKHSEENMESRPCGVIGM